MSTSIKKVIITTCSGKVLTCKTKGDAYVLLKHIGYDFIVCNKHNRFLSQLYYGKKGVVTDTVKAKQVEEFLKKYGNKPVHELLGAKIYIEPMDGRKKEAKKLPFYTVGMLF